MKNQKWKTGLYHECVNVSWKLPFIDVTDDEGVFVARVVVFTSREKEYARAIASVPDILRVIDDMLNMRVPPSVLHNRIKKVLSKVRGDA